MKKFFVKWTFTDDYGRLMSERFEWFETMEEAKAFAAEKKKKNGSYFYVYKIAEGNYEEFERMDILAKELVELKKKF